MALVAMRAWAQTPDPTLAAAAGCAEARSRSDVDRLAASLHLQPETGVQSHMQTSGGSTISFGWVAHWRSADGNLTLAVMEIRHLGVPPPHAPRLTRFCEVFGPSADAAAIVRAVAATQPATPQLSLAPDRLNATVAFDAVTAPAPGPDPPPTIGLTLAEPMRRRARALTVSDLQRRLAFIFVSHKLEASEP